MPFLSFEAFRKNKFQSNLKDTELGFLSSLILSKDIIVQKADEDITVIITHKSACEKRESYYFEPFQIEKN